MRGTMLYPFPITDAAVASALAARDSGEMIEFGDRHGVLHRGWVRWVEYSVGKDQGWFMGLEMIEDDWTRALTERFMGQPTLQ